MAKARKGGVVPIGPFLDERPKIEGPPDRETDGPERKTGPSRPKVFMRSLSFNADGKR